MSIIPNSSSHSQKGQSIIEVLIATLVVGVVMVAIASVLTMSVKNTAESKYRSAATTQGQEVLEVFRRERIKLGWNQFTQEALGGEFCFNSLPVVGGDLSDFLTENVAACEEGYSMAGTTFNRDVEVQQINDQVIVIVTVSWLDGDQEREIELQQEFQEYQP